MEIIACVFVGLYLVAGLYGLAENLTGKRTLTRTWAARAQLAALAAVWPAEVSWLLLQRYVSERWPRLLAATEPRWQGVGS